MTVREADLPGSRAERLGLADRKMPACDEVVRPDHDQHEPADPEPVRDVDRIARSLDGYREGRPHARVDFERYDFDASARSGYSTRDVHEFYAEGFSSFHQDAAHAALVQRNAPELYRRLLEESRTEGTTPSWVDSSGRVVD